MYVYLGVGTEESVLTSTKRASGILLRDIVFAFNYLSV